MAEQKDVSPGPAEVGPAEDQNIPLTQILKELLDSPGYVLFVAKIAKNTNAQGNLQIDYSYRRYHFSFEDARAAVAKFKESYINDVTEGIEHV